MKRFVILSLALLLLIPVLVIVPNHVTADPAGIPSWEQILPNLPARVWRSPWYATNDILYVTTDRDLRITVDDGDTWQTLYPRPPVTEAPGISAMAFDPAVSISPTLFLARNIPAGPAEIYRATDGGVSWTTVFSTTAGPIYDLAAARSDTGQLVVFAVGGPHIWRSVDGGDSWETAETGLPPWADIYRVYPSPDYAADKTVYLTGFGSLIRSTNGGDSWAVVSIPEVDVARHVVFSPQYAADNTLWVSYFFIEGHDTYDPNGVARSTDGGQTWEVVSDGLPVDYLDGWIMGLAVSPDYPADPSLYAVERTLQYNATTWDLYRSPNKGDKWWGQNSIPGAIPNGLLAARRNLLFLPTQNGLWRLQTDCWEWLVNGDAERNEGWQMPATPATAAYTTDEQHGGGRSISIGITTGLNRVAYSSARQKITIPSTALSASAEFWLRPVTTSTGAAPSMPDNFQVTADPQMPLESDAQYVFILDQNLNIIETLLWTLENAGDWQQYTFDLSDYIGQTFWLHFGVYNDGIGGITAMYLDDASVTACETPPPDFDRQAFLPAVRKDGTVPSVPAGPLMINGKWARQIIGHPQSAALYAVTDNGLYRSNDGGATWPLAAPLPPVTHTILMAPGQPSILYAAEGYPCLAGGEDRPMWKSTNSGQSWTELPAGLNLEPLAVHTMNSQRVYARGCDGPYLTTNGGASWQLQSSPWFLVYEARHAAPVTADNWQTVYLGCVTEGGGGGIIGSQDGGANWDLISPLNPELWAVSALANNPLDPDELFFTEPHGFWGTVDGGANWYTSTAGLEDVIYDPGGPISQTYGLYSLSYLPGDSWLLGTVEGLFTNTNPVEESWAKVAGPVWQDDSLFALLVRFQEPQKVFVTTLDGVYVYYR